MALLPLCQNERTLCSEAGHHLRGSGGAGGTIAVPANRRRRSVLGVSEDLKALSKDLLRDGQYAILYNNHFDLSRG